MSYQQRLFDDYTVSHERGTLSSFSIEDNEVTHFKADDVLVLVVTATVSGASYKHDAGGDWVRTNKLTAHEVRVADGVMKDEIVEFYNLAGDQLAFARPGAASYPVGAATAPQSPPSGGSTHVEPDVASAGNDDGKTEESPDQDFSGNGSSSARDQVLAAFLDET